MRKLLLYHINYGRFQTVDLLLFMVEISDGAELFIEVLLICCMYILEVLLYSIYYLGKNVRAGNCVSAHCTTQSLNGLSFQRWYNYHLTTLCGYYIIQPHCDYYIIQYDTHTQTLSFETSTRVINESLESRDR